MYFTTKDKVNSARKFGFNREKLKNLAFGQKIGNREYREKSGIFKSGIGNLHNREKINSPPNPTQRA